MTADIKSSFLEAEDWIRRYQRNNKRTGLKNLRCFPICGDAHRLRGFCGRPAYVEVDNPSEKSLCSWSCFYKVPKAGEEDPGIPIGKVMKKNEILDLTRTKVHQFRPWIAGESFEEDLPATVPQNAKVITFVYNKNRKGWHYSWVANKHTCDSEHVLRAYIFESLPNNEYRLLQFVDSPSFTLFCRRRQRQNFEKLPPQLKEQLKLQDEAKKNQAVRSLPSSIPVLNAKDGKKVVSALTGRVMEVPQKPPRSAKRKIEVKVEDSEGVTTLSSSKNSEAGSGKLQQQSGKRRRTRVSAAMMASGLPPVQLAVCEPAFETASGSMNTDTPLISNTTATTSSNIPTINYGDKQILLYHIMRYIMRLNVKSSTPLLNTADNDAFVFHEIHTEPNHDSTDISGEEHPPVHGHSSAGTDFNSSGNTEFQPQHQVQGLDDLSKSISECLDCFVDGPLVFPPPCQFEENDLPDNSDSFSTITKSNGLDLPDLGDFEPFDLDFSVLNDPETGTVDKDKTTPQFSEIMKEFAVCLIEETDYTATIERTLSELGGENYNPSQCKDVIVHVLLDNLSSFLSKYSLSLDELHHLFKTQIWDAQERDSNRNADPVSADGSCTMTGEISKPVSLEKRAIVLESKFQPDGESVLPPKNIRTEAINSFMQSVTHYAKTVNYMSPHSPRATSALLQLRLTNMISDASTWPSSASDGTHSSASYDSVHTSAGSSYYDLPCSSTSPKSNRTLQHEDSCSVSSRSSLNPYIPDNAPENDLTGDWVRPQETLDILEGIRETLGVPWVMRKMLRYMEMNFSLSHGNGCLEAQSNRKLLSSGFQRYILDGKEHPWILPPPIPTEKPVRHAVYRATLKNGVLRLALHFSPKKRLVRETQKSKDGSTLHSVVKFQFRNDPNQRWEDKLHAKCVAYRRIVQEDNNPETVDNFYHDLGGDELSWLAVPCDDFAMTLS